MRLAATILLMVGMASAQVFVGGQGQVRGKATLQPLGTPPPPPPPTGIAANFPNGSFNQLIPSKWPPFGSEAALTCTLASTSTCMVFGGTRLWDDGVKWGQLETGNGTYSTAFTNLNTFITTTIPAYPMDVLYTFGDTPSWAAQTSGSGITSCATPDTAHSCLPWTTLDVNQAACNADGGASAVTVHADCGNGSNSIDQANIYKMATQNKGKIKFWECWNEQDSGNFWTNSTLFGGHTPQAANQPQMVRAVRHCSDVRHIVKGVDPTAQVVSPSFHVGTALTWFDFFNQSTVNDPGCSGACSAAIGGITWPPATVQGSQTYDWVNVHGRGTSSNNADPTSFLTAYNNTVQEINLRGLPTLLMDNEWGCVNQSSLQCPTADYNASFVARALSLRAGTWANAIPVMRAWYYQNDAAGGGGSVALQGTVAGQAWDTTAKWWIGSSPTAACSNVGNVWTCPMKFGGSTTAEVKWDQSTLSKSLTDSNTAVSGSTTYDCAAANCAGLTGEYVTISGFTNAANNGSWVVSSSSVGTIVVPNAAGVAETRLGTASYIPVKCGSSCPNSSADGFTTWTDVTGALHFVVSNQVPLGAKPVLLK